MTHEQYQQLLILESLEEGRMILLSNPVFGEAYYKLSFDELYYSNDGINYEKSHNHLHCFVKYLLTETSHTYTIL